MPALFSILPNARECLFGNFHEMRHFIHHELKGRPKIFAKIEWIDPGLYLWVRYRGLCRFLQKQKANAGE